MINITVFHQLMYYNFLHIVISKDFELIWIIHLQVLLWDNNSTSFQIRELRRGMYFWGHTITSNRITRVRMVSYGMRGLAFDSFLNKHVSLHFSRAKYYLWTSFTASGKTTSMYVIPKNQKGNTNIAFTFNIFLRFLSMRFCC